MDITHKTFIYINNKRTKNAKINKMKEQINQ